MRGLVSGAPDRMHGREAFEQLVAARDLDLGLVLLGEALPLRAQLARTHVFRGGVDQISAQTDGFDWATIGAVNNPAYDGPDPDGRTLGRGALDYQFRISRFEVTTQQWMDFYNAARSRPDPLGLPIVTPFPWGAEVDPSYTGPGTHYRLRNVPNAGMLPVGGVDWRTSAIFCNWIENGRGTSRSDFAQGVYDASTFTGGGGTWGDQPAHDPSAHYWIPTLDEVIKSFYFDPNKNGPGQPGWWLYPTSSDTPPIYGPPGTGQANAAFNLPGDGQYLIPLGSYPQTRSPWGLLDTSGATSEYTESILQVDTIRGRRIQGGYWGIGGGDGDLIYGAGALFPTDGPTFAGLRIASTIPSPGATAVLTMGIGLGILGARRRSQNETPTSTATATSPPTRT
jgi:formylglycine-generating enzyme required for sulfatase activity